MPAPFDDLKPWPADPGADRHHNQPPLEDRIRMEFDDALAAKGLDARVAEIIASADKAPAEIISPGEAGMAADLVAMARDAKQAIEAEREALNRPLLIAQRSLKAKADGVVAPMEAAVAAVRDRLDAYVAGTDAPALGDYGAKASARETWEFQIEDYSKLPRDIRRHPEVLEAMAKVVARAVRGGARKIAGVRIYPKTKAMVR
jgi:hypothetical protein